MRNVKFSGWLVSRHDDYSRRYVEAMMNGGVPTFMIEHYLSQMNRLRNVLEFRYNTIV